MFRLAVGALALFLMAASVRADVIPTRRSDAGAADARKAVSGRLQELGLSPADASEQAGRLLDREARYFAADSSRVQVAGRDDDGGAGHGEKVLLGTVYFLAGAGVLAVLGLRD